MLNEDELLQVENYLSSKGIQCGNTDDTPLDTSRVLAINGNAGSYYTIAKLKENAKDTFQTLANKVTAFQATPDDTHYPSEKLVKNSLDGKSDSGHTHDDRYYTESEIDTKVSALNTSISSEATARQSADTTLQANIDKKLPLAGGTMTGTVNSQSVIPKANDTYDLGSSSNEFKNAFLQRLATIYFSLGGVELNDAGFHNTIPRCANVTKYITDGSLYNRMQGSGYKLFDDLYVGDYFTTGSKTIAGDTRDRWWQFLGFDCFLHCGGSDITKHHAVIAPCTSDGQNTSVICSMAMYDSTPFTQGYLGSKPCQAMLGAQTVSGTTYSEGSIATAMKEIFGDHIIPTQELLNTTNEGTNWQWYTMYGSLMSEIEVYGARIWGVDSGYDNLMSARGQLPLFKLKPSLISTRSYGLWLRSVYTSSSFALVDSFGRASYSTATASRGIRPRFLIG